MRAIACLAAIVAVGLAAVLPLASCGPPPALDAEPIAAAVLEVLDMQVEAWNRGDIEGFMAGYLNSEELRFASGAEVQRGWSGILERYRRRYPDRAAMGALAFEEIEVRAISDRAALVFGRYRLTRETDEPTGLFTLLFELHDDRWLIVADHTSS